MVARFLCTSGACVGLRIERAGRSGECGCGGSEASCRDGLRLWDAEACLLVEVVYAGSRAKLAVLWWLGLAGRPYMLACCCCRPTLASLWSAAYACDVKVEGP